MSAQARSGLSTSLFPLLVLGLLAGMSFWLEMASRLNNGPADGKTRHDPDYRVENFEVRRFNPDGDLQHTLRATFMQHFPDDDTTEVTAPDLTYHRAPPTHVTSRTARLDSNGKHVTLIDDVKVTRGGQNGQDDTVLVTTRLDAFPDDEIATTREPVTLVRGPTFVNGVGMEANNQTGIYVLDGPVRGIFHRSREGGKAVVAPAAAAPVAAAKPKSATKSQPKAKPKPKAKPQRKPQPKPKSKPKAKRNVS